MRRESGRGLVGVSRPGLAPGFAGFEMERLHVEHLAVAGDLQLAVGGGRAEPLDLRRDDPIARGGQRTPARKKS